MNRDGKQAVPQSILPAIAKATMMDGARLYNPEEILEYDSLMVLEHAYEGIPLDRSKIKKGGKKVAY